MTYRPVFRGGNNEYFIDADERIEKIKGIISQQPVGTFVNIICSLSTYDYFTKAFANVNNVKVNLIENHLYGGSVSVSGLLNHGDIKSQFQPERNDLMIMPMEMYTSEGRELQGEHISDLEIFYNTKIVLV